MTAPVIQSEFHRIALDAPPYLIAEIGLNHNGDLALAKRIAAAARDAGAHAAKFQLYDAAAFLNANARLGDGPPGTLQEFFRQFELQPGEWKELAAYVREDLGLDFFCSVFDDAALELYRELDCRLLKIASCDINHRDLFAKIAADRRWHVLFSTGTAEEAEVARAVGWLRDGAPAGRAVPAFLIFECVSSYPANPADYRPALVSRWAARYECLTGISDHCTGNEVSVEAVRYGARAVERHFTIDRNLPGPDQQLSLDPADFRRLADAVAAAFAEHPRPIPTEEPSLAKTMQPCEATVRAGGRRSVYARTAISSGQTITEDMLIAQRPGGGIPADRLSALIGVAAPENFAMGDALPVSLLDGAAP